MSHKIRSGILAKKHWKDADLFRMFHELTPSQMSFFRECVVQEMGGKKSAFWGHQKIPFKIKHNCSKKDLMFFLEALNHPTHIFARKMSLNKNAAGFGASVGRAVVKVGRTVGKYAAKGAKWMAAHAKQIMGGLDMAIGAGVQGVTMAYQMGLLDDQSDATLLGLTQMAGMAHDIYHADDAAAAEKKEEKPTSKEGKGWLEDMDKRMKTPRVQKQMHTAIAKQKEEAAMKQKRNTAFWDRVNALNALPVKESKWRQKTLPMKSSHHEDSGGSMFDKMEKAYHRRKELKSGGNLDFGVEQSKPKWMQLMDKTLDRHKERQAQNQALASYRGKHQIRKKNIQKPAGLFRIPKHISQRQAAETHARLMKAAAIRREHPPPKMKPYL